jgi:ABC-2 type transport system permease protein
MTAFAYHFAFEFRTGVRNKMAMFLNYMFPLGFYLMMGFIMPGLNEYFKDVIIPAMVTFAVLAVTLLGLPEPLVDGREKGVFRSYKINGVPASSILFIPALTTTVHLSIVSAIIVVTAPVLFDAAVPTNWISFAVTFLALVFACAGLGVLIGVVAPDARASILLSQLVFVPAMLIGGMMIPYDVLQDVVAEVAQLLPATHAMNAFKGLAMGETADFFPEGSILVLFACGLTAFGLAYYLFSWDRKNADRRGHPALALLALLPFVVGIIVL